MIVRTPPAVRARFTERFAALSVRGSKSSAMKVVVLSHSAVGTESSAQQGLPTERGRRLCNVLSKPEVEEPDAEGSAALFDGDFWTCTAVGTEVLLRCMLRTRLVVDATCSRPTSDEIRPLRRSRDESFGRGFALEKGEGFHIPRRAWQTIKRAHPRDASFRILF